MDKKNKKIIIITILGTVLFLGGLFSLAALFSYKKSLENRKVLMDCFTTFAAIKCGAVDNTENQIEREMTKTLKLSPEKARRAILKEKKKAEESLRELNQKTALTDYEKSIKKSLKEDLFPYYGRVLRVIDLLEEKEKQSE